MLLRQHYEFTDRAFEVSAHLQLRMLYQILLALHVIVLPLLLDLSFKEFWKRALRYLAVLKLGETSLLSASLIGVKLYFDVGRDGWTQCFLCWSCSRGICLFFGDARGKDWSYCCGSWRCDSFPIDATVFCSLERFGLSFLNSRRWHKLYRQNTFRILTGFN